MSDREEALLAKAATYAAKVESGPHAAHANEMFDYVLSRALLDAEAECERLKREREGVVCIGKNDDGFWGRACARQQKELNRLRAVVADFADTVSRAERALATRNQGGQHVSFHGDFCAATPSVIIALERWVKAFDAATKPDGER